MSDNMMCGGIHSHETELMKQLLVEVMQVLDPHNAVSFAFLEGEERNRAENNWIDDILEAAQIESKKNWAIAIEEANYATNTLHVSIVPTLADTTRRKAIIINRSETPLPKPV